MTTSPLGPPFQPPATHLHRGDWSLHRKGAIDRERHQRKVREAIRDRLGDLVSEQSILSSDGKRIVRVPIRTLEEYKFRFDQGSREGVGAGTGETQVGDVVERGTPAGSGSGAGAGNQPGVEFYEAEVSIDELAGLVFEDLALPNLEPRRERNLETETIRFNDVRRSGPFANLDKKQTIRRNLLRNARVGAPRFGGLTSDDLRFRTWEPTTERESNAVVLAMMDVSGSMGVEEKEISRAFFFWMVRFLRTRYDQVEIVFIAHHAEAKEVTEEEFFTRGESGGTRASTAYALALDILAQRYPVEDWNTYPFHFSDGDNWPSDNEPARLHAERLVGLSNLFGYGEIRTSRNGHPTSLASTLGRIEAPKLVQVTLTGKQDVYAALRVFFAQGDDREAA